jgi:hypothetical protein
MKPEWSRAGPQAGVSEIHPFFILLATFPSLHESGPSDLWQGTGPTSEHENIPLPGSEWGAPHLGRAGGWAQSTAMTQGACG